MAEPCAMKAALLRAYQQAILSYTTTVIALEPTALSKYKSLLDYAEEAEKKATSARHELKTHIDEHGC
jgi:hypothetical protein